jgi:hypothetical protein
VKPLRHPLLFSVLAIVLSILILNAAIIDVSAPIPLVLVAIAIIGGMVGSFLAGYFLHAATQKMPESPGVDFDSYADAVFGGWRTYFKNVLHTVDFITHLMGRYDLYYIRRAEYRSLDYLSYQDPPEKMMIDVAKELCIIQTNLVKNVKDAIIEADNVNDQYLTQTTESININLIRNNNFVYSNLKIVEMDRDSVRIEAYGRPDVVWNCETMEPVSPGSGNAYYDLEKYLVLGGSIQAVFARILSGETTDIIDKISRGQSLSEEFRSTESGSFLSVMSVMIARLSEIYSQAKNFARAYHYTLRTLGFTSKSDVPVNYICPPPDVMIFDASELAKRGASPQDIAVQYLAYLQSMAEKLDVASGCLQQGQVTYTQTTYVTTYTTVMGGTTTVVTETVTTVVNATTSTYTTVYTTVINGTQTVVTETVTTVYGGTPTTYVTTYTTVLGGSTATITTTTSGWVYITPWGTYIPDPFTRLQNATIILPDGARFTVAEITVIDTVEDVTFRAGECTTLQSPITAMMAFYNGTVKTTLLPSGTGICPEKIVTPQGEVSSYTYHEMPYQQWVQKHYGSDQPPTLLEPSSNTITMLLSMMIVMMPLLLIVMLMRAFSDMAGRRAIDLHGRRVGHAAKAKP